MMTVAGGEAAIHLRRAWACDLSCEANLVLCLTFTGSIGIITNFITDNPAVRDILSRLGESTAPTHGAPRWARWSWSCPGFFTVSVESRKHHTSCRSPTTGPDSCWPDELLSSGLSAHGKVVIGPKCCHCVAPYEGRQWGASGQRGWTMDQRKTALPCRPEEALTARLRAAPASRVPPTRQCFGPRDRRAC